MKIQVLSDLHLELLNMSEIWENHYQVNCDVLCLVGDIGNPYSDIYWSFINYASKNAKYVLIVSGNHEYRGNSQQHLEYWTRAKAKEFKNVEYLQKDLFFYGGYVFLGCTLWSHIPHQYAEEFKACFADFTEISNFSPFVRNIIHKEHKKWLENVLLEAKQRELKTVVLTHHTPLYNISCGKKHKGSPTQHMFSTDMRELFNNVDVWCYGHTHSNRKSHVYKVHPYKTLFVSNQKGHPKNSHSNFDSGFSLSLPEDNSASHTTFRECDINL